MNVYHPSKATRKLESKLNYLKGAGLRQLADAIAKEIIEGNRTDRLSGIDSNGYPQTPVLPRKGRYKLGIGPPLAPFGAASRVVSRFRATVKGQPGRFEVVAGWDNVVSKSGVPFLPFHDRGVPNRPASKPNGFLKKLASVLLPRPWRLPRRGGWWLPRRPIFGISPKTMTKIEQTIENYLSKSRGIT